MEIQIANIEELASILGRAYWIESEMELVIQWEAYMKLPEKFRDVLFRLSHDSATHKSYLKRLSSNLEKFDLNEATKSMQEKKFDFKGMLDEEIMSEILRYEILSLDLYEKLYQQSSMTFIYKIWKGEEPEDYFKMLYWLIEQEKEHIELVRPLTGKIERIL